MSIWQEVKLEELDELNKIVTNGLSMIFSLKEAPIRNYFDGEVVSFENLNGGGGEYKKRQINVTLDLKEEKITYERNVELRQFYTSSNYFSQKKKFKYTDHRGNSFICKVTGYDIGKDLDYNEIEFVTIKIRLISQL